MKLVSSILFICAFVWSATAQTDYTKSLSGVDWVKIESKSGIELKTHDKNELLIKVSSRKKKSEKAKGLKLVGAGGTDNTDVGFYVVQDGGTMLVKNLRRSEKAEIFLPKTQNVSVTNSWNGDIYIAGFSGEVEANANLNGGLKMENLSGPVTAYSLNQGIEVSFDKISQDAPIVIRTTNGEIDVTLPENTSADMELSSWNGDIYTNFDLQRPDKEGLKSVSGKNIKGAINGGGVAIKLKSTNGTIYLRKK
ncbi:MULTISPECIES: DUF4097 family beta strand repeat-containing protein [Croceitalea]|uniref:DUF4097 family beta strand repeat-containing protein n=1 Tax=Croceitalea vernalis TaxID=3075599 RepID=A0ABU3BF18_9FLAO|nr:MULTISPECIES: DUF4097 family beta strand repeat-containing protein [unclassified Croceitalea]MDT0538963.1 DUF4097 family beta strand repeat-containing protein [Croceitalea sp. P059]MDT0620751.1 DUF4097 family beta strand repeat-containing protein [Croceitalea sp. P007]